jgi:hypothetical protein
MATGTKRAERTLGIKAIRHYVRAFVLLQKVKFCKLVTGCYSGQFPWRSM